MANNTLLHPDQITREALRILHQESTFLSTIHRDYDSSFAKKGGKIGETLRIRLPNQYTVRRGNTMVTQDTNERSTTLSIVDKRGVDLNFSSDELTLTLDDFSTRIIKPAMSVLAADIEAHALNTMRRDVFQQVGEAGTALVNLRTPLLARKRLVDSLAPNTKRYMLLNTQDNVDLVDSLSGLFNNTKEVGKQYLKGYMGETAGFTFMESTHLTPQERGDGANYQSDGVDQTGSAITVDTGTGTIKAGEIITFDGVERVHPETKAPTGELQQFVVLDDFAGGAGQINISPAVEVTGAYQNVNQAIADDAAITIFGAVDEVYGQSLAYCPEAFTFATADLIKPDGVDMCSRQVYDGISMRLIRDYQIGEDELPARIDVLYGFKTIRPQLACRVAAN